MTDRQPIQYTTEFRHFLALNLAYPLVVFAIPWALLDDDLPSKDVELHHNRGLSLPLFDWTSNEVFGLQLMTFLAFAAMMASGQCASTHGHAIGVVFDEARLTHVYACAFGCDDERLISDALIIHGSLF